MRLAATLGLGGLVLLAACNTTVPQLTAAVTGGAAGAATVNPALGFAVGVATDAAANYVARYYVRSRAGAEQDLIAQLAGGLPVGDNADWKIEHFIPLGNEHGQLRVVAVTDTPLATCRHIAFSVDEGKPGAVKQHWYTADICKDAKAWKWATAEPAVARWGFLQ